MRRPTKFHGMMYEFCIDLGWCGSTVKDGKPMLVTDFIPDSGPVSADQFVEWLVAADGADLNTDEGALLLARWREELKAVFVKHMGAEVVDAAQLR